MARKRKPSFFKVLIGDFSDQLQRTPQVFHKHFDERRLPQLSHLRTTAGTWPVDMKADNGKFSFQKGWKEFVHDHGLRLGQFLVFRYAGNSKFFVDVYGRDGCIKEFLVRSKASQEAVVVKSEPFSDAAIHTSVDVDESIRNVTTKETSVSQPRVANQTGATSIAAANGYTSNYPCFRVFLNKAYATKGILHIPSKYRDVFKLRASEAKLQVSNKVWSVKWIQDGASSRFSRGWSNFVRDNDLKGDVCVFELVKQTYEVVMEVSFFRC